MMGFGGSGGGGGGDEGSIVFRCTPPVGGVGRSDLDPATARPSLLLFRELVDQVRG